MKAAVTLICVLMMGTATAKGAFDDTDDAIQYRQAAFGLIKENFADMGAMLKKKKPMDSEAFAQRAQHLALLAEIPFTGFIPGSDKGKTDALGKVWQQRSDFDQRASQFAQATATLAQVSQGNDLKATAKAFGDVGKTCKGCHDNFKKD
ncbi:c-type cytochrome [Ferrimonas marina]|uniref:Cytochrome c556 n=1 Tax=Ferrimonas marina TaxID=299255 RepID=A0A1M5ZTN2_9GAMM|nr:cytochrome c [Ferrimonas marina]SHI27552.1 Cytochrome c556 [Ferrimonas marina]